jgi:hypothetical protein
MTRFFCPQKKCTVIVKHFNRRKRERFVAQIDSWGAFASIHSQSSSKKQTKPKKRIQKHFIFSISSVFCESVFNVGPRLLPSHRVDRDVDLEAGGFVSEESAHVVLEEVSDPVELHDVARLLVEPELVELDEEVAVKVVEVTQRGNDVAV